MFVWLVGSFAEVVWCRVSRFTSVAHAGYPEFTREARSAVGVEDADGLRLGRQSVYLGVTASVLMGPGILGLKVATAPFKGSRCMGSTN